MNISIVIPSYNASKTISKTLEACLSQSLPADIIVVDDGSTDNSKEKITKYPVTYIYQQNAGPATARNTGWKAAKGDIVIFTDSDCVPDNNWVSKLVKLFDSEDIGATGGTYGIMNPESITALSIHNEIQFRHSTLPEYVRYLGSFSLAVRRTVLEKLGGFDESFRIACGEDADLTYRLNNLGYKMRFTRDCVVGHFFPERLSKFLKQQFWRGYWIMKLFAKHNGKLGKDDYSKLTDTIQPPLYAVISLLLPSIFLKPVLVIFVLMNILALLLHLPVVSFSVKNEKSLKMLYLFVLLHLRGFFWAAGCTAGTFRFIIFHERLG